MAACAMLRLLVISSRKDLPVFALPVGIASATGMRRLRDIEGDFDFCEKGVTGRMAFAGLTPTTRCLWSLTLM